MCHRSAVALFFFGALSFAHAQPAPEIDPKIVKAWEAAGARFEWASGFEYHTWKYSRFKPKEERSLPAINFGNLTPKQVAVLPELPTLFVFGGGDQFTFKDITELKGLFGLNRRGEEINDEKYKLVAAAQHIRALSLATSNTTSEKLKQLANLKNLEHLNLGATAVDTAGMKTVCGFTKLKTLYLDSCDMKDAGLQEIAALRELHTLNLNHTNITDAGLKEVGRLKNLQVLNLGINQGITDKGMKELAALPVLRKLYVDTTQITDEGLKDIARVESLKYLSLVGTKTTAKAKEELRKLRPGLETFPP